MALQHKIIVGILCVFMLSMVAIWFRPPPDLQFERRSSPAGFRELLLTGGASQFDPILGFPGAGQADARMGSTAICEALFGDSAAPTSGRGGTPVVAFLDYRCPYCRTLTKILSALQAEKELRLIYKEWPILGASSELAARAALAAHYQGQYEAFHMRLMETRLIPTEALIENIATDLKLDVSRLRRDMMAPEVTRMLSRNAMLAAQFGFAGTPALVVGRTVVQGEVTRSQLERLLAGPENTPPC